MFVFLFGFITGIVFCIFIVVIEIWLNNFILTEVKNKIKKQLKVKSEIITNPSIREKSVKEIIKKNEDKGIPTPIEEFYD